MTLLRFTNKHGERYFFAHLGGPWHSDPTKRMIDRTVSSINDAKKFGSVDEARTILAVTDNVRSKEWEIVDETGKVVG